MTYILKNNISIQKKNNGSNSGIKFDFDLYNLQDLPVNPGIIQLIRNNEIIAESTDYYEIIDQSNQIDDTIFFSPGVYELYDLNNTYASQFTGHNAGKFIKRHWIGTPGKTVIKQINKSSSSKPSMFGTYSPYLPDDYIVPSDYTSGTYKHLIIHKDTKYLNGPGSIFNSVIFSYQHAIVYNCIISLNNEWSGAYQNYAYAPLGEIHNCLFIYDKPHIKNYSCSAYFYDTAFKGDYNQTLKHPSSMAYNSLDSHFNCASYCNIDSTTGAIINSDGSFNNEIGVYSGEYAWSL